jgi:hypothetical protein
LSIERSLSFTWLEIMDKNTPSQHFKSSRLASGLYVISIRRC